MRGFCDIIVGGGSDNVPTRSREEGYSAATAAYGDEQFLLKEIVESEPVIYELPTLRILPEGVSPIRY
jgi:hypothetical protein